MDYQRHESSHIYPHSKIGKGTIISEGAIIHHNVTIGENCYIGPYAVIGEPGEHLGHHNSKHGYTAQGHVVIGCNTRLSEFVRVQSPCDRKITHIGNDCLLMAGVHIGHDCFIGDFVNIAPNAVICGNVTIKNRVGIGCNAVIHQRQTIEIGVMIGAGSFVSKTHKSSPWKIIYGNPAMVHGWNIIGMERAGLKMSDIPIEDRKEIIYPE